MLRKERTPRCVLTAALAAASLLVMAGPGWAATESGDAGDLPASAQEVNDTSISGTIASSSDVDMYKVCLSTRRPGRSRRPSPSAAPSFSRSPPTALLFYVTNHGLRQCFGDRHRHQLRHRHHRPSAALPIGVAITPDGSPRLCRYLRWTASSVITPLPTPSPPPSRSARVLWQSRSRPQRPRLRDQRRHRTACRIDAAAACATPAAAGTYHLAISGQRWRSDLPGSESGIVGPTENGGSGLADCVGTVADGDLIDTSDGRVVAVHDHGHDTPAT